MKKLLVIAVALASVNAFASRARMTALGNSAHLTDTQTVYSNPADMFLMGDYMTLESGIGTAASSDRTGANNAEGMVVRSMGDAKAGLSLGHTSALSTTLRNAAISQFPTRSKYLQQNPIGLFYGMKNGDLSWGGTLVYSNYQNKIAPNEKETSTGVVGGFRMGAMYGSLQVGLTNTYQNDTDGKFNGTAGYVASFGYQLDTTYISAGLTLAGFKTENAAGAETLKFATTSYEVKATNAVKKDGSEFFYSAGISNTERKTTVAAVDTTVTTLAVPLKMGVEADANSWLTLRGSVTQSVPVLTSTKTTSGNPSTTSDEASPTENNTEFAAGAGLKFNKMTVDGTILAGGTQTYSSTALLGQVGLTYNF